MKSEGLIVNFILLLLIIPFFSLIVKAAPNADTTISPIVNRLTKTQEQKDKRQITVTQVQGERMEKLRTRALAEIDRRLKALAGLIERINNLKRLTADQKSSLTSSIQEQIASLTDPRAKIQADTDLATLKTDIKSIVDSYRIFALFMPKVHIFVVAEVELNYADRLSELAIKLQTRIEEAKNSGQDVASLQTLLTEMQSKISEAKIQAQKVIDTVIGLTPDGYPGNKTTLESAREMLQTARQSLQQARNDASQIIAGVKGLKGGIIPTVTSAAAS